ncbi:MAG: glycosyltransferase family 4 protein [Alphaproteobacteria bacterium]|nr:glycosyltransferase family 4 protein [Alphaproteobacteria bacterium]
MTALPADDPGHPKAPLHILQMCTMFGVGGISRHVLDYSAWLRARGHRVSFAGTPNAWLNAELESDFLPLPTQKVAGEEGASLASRLGFAARSALDLRRWLAGNRVDLIHAHESAPGLVARLATLGSATPLAVTYHGSEPGRVKQFGSIARLADLVITPSHRSGADLVKVGGVSPERLKVIGLGVKTAPVPEPARVAQTRARLLGEGGERLVVTIARITEQKGIDILIDCVKRLIPLHPEFRFALVGDGPQEAEAHAWAEAAGVTSHLTFVGRSAEPQLYLRAADAFLLTSRWEALPFTIAEAFQAGTPAIATDCSGCAELIDASVGRIVPIGDVEAICGAVTEVLTDDEARAAMASAALVRSREARFSPDHIHAELESVYRALATRPRARV